METRAGSLHDNIYSVVMDSIRKNIRMLRDKYGITRITIEDDTSSNDLPYAEFSDGKNTYDDVDFIHKIPHEDHKAVNELLEAVKFLERLTSDERLEMNIEGVEIEITFI